MSRLFIPIILSKSVANNDVLREKEEHEKTKKIQCEALCEHTNDETIKEEIQKYHLWVNWNESHFPLIKKFIELSQEMETLEDSFKKNPDLVLDMGILKEREKLKKSLKVSMEILGLTKGIIVLADELQEKLKVDLSNEDDEISKLFAVMMTDQD